MCPSKKQHGMSLTPHPSYYLLDLSPLLGLKIQSLRLQESTDWNVQLSNLLHASDHTTAVGTWGRAGNITKLLEQSEQ
jgi:hypothetical protein